MLEQNAKVILLSHIGKVKTEDDKKQNSLKPVYEKLKKLLNYPIYFSNETRGKELEKKISTLSSGEALLVENTRYEDLKGKKESSCDEELSAYWANLADIYVNDAYGTSHRSHASNVGISKILPNAVGFLIEKEMSKLDEIMNENTKPFVVIMGGKKISDKTLVIENLITKCDKILVGGGMCFTFLKKYELSSTSS